MMSSDCRSASKHCRRSVPRILLRPRRPLSRRTPPAAPRTQPAQHAERLQKLGFQAGRWTELHGRRAGVRRKREDAERLLADAAGIECDAARLQELREVLPKVQTVMEQRSQFAESE